MSADNSYYGNQIPITSPSLSFTPTISLVEGSTGNNFNIQQLGSTYTINLPSSSSSNRGLLTSADWTLFNAKQGALTLTTTGTGGAATLVGNTLNIPQYANGITGTGIVKSTSGTISYITDNSSDWNTAYTNRITSASAPLSISVNAISISQANSTTDGYLSSTDWTTFNNKQNTLTNPVTGTGTANSIPMFTGTTSVGNAPLTIGTTGEGLSIEGGVLFGGGSLNFKNYSFVTTKGAGYSSISTNTSKQFIFTYEGSASVILDLTNITGGKTYTMPNVSGTLVTGTGTLNQLTYFTATNTIGSLSTATYPSLTELSYVKGVTSAIQTQLNAKQDTLTLTTTGTSGAATLVGSTLNIPQYAAGITGSGTSGQIAYWNGTSSQTGSNNLFWDATNNRLGIGTNTPANTLDINGTARISNLGGVANNSFTFSVSSAKPSILYNTNGYMIRASSDASECYIQATNYLVLTNSGNELGLRPAYAYYTAGLMVGSSTNSGYKLDVNGTSRHNGQTTLTGSVTAAANLAQGVIVTPTLTTSNVGDFLVGLDISPTFSNPIAYGNVTNLAIRTNSAIQIGGSITSTSGGISSAGIVGTSAISATGVVTASAANNILVGLDVSTTFNSAGFTGVSTFFARFANTSGGTSLPATTGTAQTGGILRLGRDNGVLDIGSNSASGAWLQSTNRNDLSLGYVLYLNPNGGNVAIGTTSPGAYKLDVNGTARVSETITSNLSTTNWDLGTYNILDLQRNGISRATFKSNGKFSWNNGTDLIIDSGSGTARTILSSVSTEILAVSNQAAIDYNARFSQTAGKIAVRVLGISGTTQNLFEVLTGASVNAFNIFSSGNVGINSTTDSGYKLDVNGTARVQGDFTAVNTNNTFGNTTTQNVLTLQGTQNTYLKLSDVQWGTNLQIVKNSTKSFLIESNSNGWLTYGASPYFVLFDCSRLSVAISTTTSMPFPNNSAVLDLTSTTKGFLPPRMTGAQGEAISSPAAGLMIYTTSAGTGAITSAGWWGYNGTTWVLIK